MVRDCYIFSVSSFVFFLIFHLCNSQVKRLNLNVSVM